MTQFTQIPAAVTAAPTNTLSTGTLYMLNAFLAHMPKGTIQILNSDGTQSDIKYAYYQTAQTPSGNPVRIYQIAIEIAAISEGSAQPIWKHAIEPAGSTANMQAPFL
jgi:hypothetical protein